GEIHPALNHLKCHDCCDAGHQCQHREADDIYCRESARARSGAESLEKPTRGEELSGQSKESNGKVDRGEDARLCASIMHRRSHDMGLPEVENSGAKR